MYVATTASESYIFQGFGTTEDEAKHGMVDEINEFFGVDVTFTDIDENENFMNVEVYEVVLGHGITSVRY